MPNQSRWSQVALSGLLTQPEKTALTANMIRMRYPAPTRTDLFYQIMHCETRPARLECGAFDRGIFAKVTNMSTEHELYGQTAIRNNQLERFENRTLVRRYTVEFTCPEFTCLCPRSGFPD